MSSARPDDPSRFPLAALPGLRGLAPLSPFWQLQIVGWTLLAVATLPLKVAAFGSIPAALAVALYREPLGFLLSSGLRLFYRRLGLASSRPARLVVFSLAASLLCGLADAALGALIDLALRDAPSSPQLLLGVFSYRTALFVVWSFLYFWLKTLLAARAHELALVRMRADAREAELQLLRAQLDPHFLFNSLNTVLSTLEPGQHSARRVVEGLADYLRYSLRHRHDTLVPLHAEYEATLAYLAVERERFRDELLADCRLEDGARDFPVPGVLLQPLVENAVKYARQTSEPPYRIRLHITAPAPGVVEIEVANTGAWVEPSAQPGPHGTGLANLRQRLALLYPDRHALTLTPAEGWVTVRVRLTGQPPPAPARHA